MAAQPTVTITPTDTTDANGDVPVLLGNTEVLTLSFSNPGDTPGFKPYIDLYVPRNGADGATAQDGLVFKGATYLGAAVDTVLLTFDSSGNATHPFAKNADGTAVVLHGNPGDQVAVLTLPFGSFTPGQTAADLKVTLGVPSTAKVGTSLQLTAVPGFAFGQDPLNNPTTDAPLRGAASTATIDPTLVSLSTKYIGPEQETATGPSYPREYKVTAVIAPGQTITNLVLTDTLPDGAVYTGAHSVNGAATITYDAATRTVTATFTDPVTGAASVDNDPQLIVDYYVGQLKSDGTPVLDPATGAFTLEPDNATLSGTWTPVNPLHQTTNVSVDMAGPEDQFTAKSIAVQKSVAVVDRLAPGGHLEWTLNGQVSNYFDLDHLKFTDVLGDGQHFDSSYTPVITLQNQGVVLYSGVVDTSEYTVVRDSGTGQTTLVFDVSKILTDHGKPADLNGGTADSPAPATAVLTFRSVIDTNYLSTDNPPPVSTLVDQGDTISNGVDFSGQVVSTHADVHDGSAAKVELPTNTVAKSVYAVNGVKTTGAVSVASGDLITYKLTLATPLTSTQRVTLTDFLPLPVLVATDPNDTGSGSFTFDNTVSGIAPDVGHAQFGAGTTYSGDVPTLSVNAAKNSLTFDFGNFTLSPNYPSNTIEVLFTVRVKDAAFGDGLLLTNEVTESETNSFGTVTEQNAIVQFTLNEPKLRIQKASVYASNSSGKFTGTEGPATFNHSTGKFSKAVTSTGLASTPFSDKLTNVDAGDTVTFAVVVENQGHSGKGAFDTVIRDTLPSYFTNVTNLRVTDGNGTALAYEVVGDGLFDPNGGIRLIDTDANHGAIAGYSATGGSNVVLITYDAVLADQVPVPLYTLTNTAAIATYAAEEGGINRVASSVAADMTASTQVVTAQPLISKSLVSTSQAFTTGSTLAVGESATFRIVVTLPEGKTQAFHLDDLLPSGSSGSLTYLSARVVSIGSHISGSTLAVGAAPTSVTGNDVLFDFGDLLDQYDNTVSTADQIEIEVVARAGDVTGNAGGKTLTNRAVASEANPNGGSRVTQTATASVKLVEPQLSLVKTVSSTDAHGGGTASYTLHVVNAAGTNSASAFNLVVKDALATQLGSNATLVAGSVTAKGDANATVITGNTAGDTTLEVDLDQLDPGESEDITFTVKLSDHVLDGTAIGNTATVTGQTLPGNDPNARTDSANGTAKLQLDALTAIKSLIATSDINTAGPKLTIGEVATFQLTVTLPKGDSPSLHIKDVLPAGLKYVVGSAKVTSVGSALFSLDGKDLYAPTVTQSGQSLDLSFGGIYDDPNAAADAGQTITITLQALAADVATNTSGTVLTNQASVTSGTTTYNTATSTTTVVLPHLAVTKTAVLDSGAAKDAGAMATYTISISHAADSTGPAYLLKLADILPTDTALDASSITASVGTVVQTASGLALTVPQFLLTDAPITLTYRAAYKDSVTPGETLTNTATLDYSSETTNGRAGTQLTAVASTAVVLQPHVAKTIVSTSDANTTASKYSAGVTDVAIGETITYRITATLGEGTQHLVISDALPAGLIFLSGQVEAYGANVSGGSAAGTAPTVGNGTVTFDLGTVVNHGDNATDGKDQVSVLVTVRVADGSAAAAVLTNTGSATTSAPGTGAGSLTDTATAKVEVVAPVLALAKTTTFTSGDAGDVATYTITVSHAASSTSAAYLLNLADLIPSDDSVVAGSVVASAGTVMQTASGGLVLTVPQFLLTDAPITLTYKTVYKDSVTPGESVTNTATLNYSSAPANGHAGTPVSASATTKVALAPQVAKTVVSTSDSNTTAGTFRAGVTDVAVGETITYRITATLGEGTQRLVISDALPTGLIFVSGQVEAYGANVSGGKAAGTAPTVSNGTVTFDLGTVVNRGDNVSDAKDQVSVLVTARVLDNSAVGALLTNTGTATTSAPGTGAGSVSTSTTAAVEVVAPKLDIDKSTSFTTGDAGDLITYTVVISQDALSSAAAYNLLVQDALAPGLVLVAGSARSTAGTVTEAGGVTLNLSQLKLTDGPIVLTYQARLADGVVDGQTITNTAQLSYSSAPSNGHASTAQDTATVGVHIADSVKKEFLGSNYGVDPLSRVGTGELLTYRITATLGEGAQRISLSDLLPTGMAYAGSKVVSLGNVSGSSLVVGQAGTYDTATRLLSFDFGDVTNPGDNVLSAGDTIVVEVQTLVTEEAEGTKLTDTATLTASDPASKYGPPAGSNTQVHTDTSTQTVANAGPLGGFAFYDANCDGVYDLADPVMKGITMRLLDGTGHFTGATTTTDSTGHYQFDHLHPGSYQVQFVQPIGVNFTYQHAGTNAARDSDADSKGITQTVTLHSTQSDLTLNAGFYFNADLNYGTQTVTLNPGQGWSAQHNGGTLIFGSTGADNVMGGRGGNVALLGKGNDTYESGFGGVDFVTLCEGDDQAQQQGDGGYLFGGNGNDLLQGQYNSAYMAGGAGDDQLVAGGGPSVLIGGTDNGTISYSNGVFSNVKYGDMLYTGNYKNAPTKILYEKGDGVDFLVDYRADKGDTITIYGYSGFTAVGRLDSGLTALYLGDNAAFILQSYDAATAASITFAPDGVKQPQLVLSIDDQGRPTLTDSGVVTMQSTNGDIPAPTVTFTSRGGLVSQDAQTISGTGKANGTVTLLDGSTVLGTAAVGVDGRWSADVTLSGRGSHTLTAQQTGLTGKVGSATQTLTLGTKKADLSGDKVSDIVLQKDGTVVDWLMQNGQYQSGNVLTTGATGYSVVGAGDFNGDGTTDLLLQSGGTVVEWLMKDGAYHAGSTITTGADGYKVVGTGDFNGDGTTDILLQNGGTVVEWLMKDGAYQSGGVLATGADGFKVAGTGDFNGDGTTDILLQNGGTVVAWMMKNGAYQSGSTLTTAAGDFKVVGAGDFNGDGTDDVLLQDSNGTVVDWIMQNGAYASANVVTNGAVGWSIRGTGDLNGDGTDDVVLQSGGTVVDWVMQDGKFQTSNFITNGATGYTVVV